MVREAVLPTDDIERLSLFFPIKVVNGFVTCDFMLGCYCCRFCLNRRYPDWHELLQTKKIYRNTMGVDQAIRLLGRVRALTHGRITLKIGHDTDMSLEEAEAQELVDKMPVNQPIVFMRRGRLQERFRAFHLKPRRNLLMKLTLTPRSEFLGSNIDPFPILDSFHGLKTNMFFAVGPVCEENADEARAIIRALPKGSRLWVRDLIVKDVPGYSLEDPSAFLLGEGLRRFAEQQGHTVVNYLNCIVRSGVGLTFHKCGEFISEHNEWQLKWSEQCEVNHRCKREVSKPEATNRISSALRELGLSLTRPPMKFGFNSYRVFVRQDVNFGDECYVRECTGLKVDLLHPGRKTGSSLSAAIAERWRAREFFPVDEVLNLARESFATAKGISIAEASHCTQTRS